jgi:putative RNA 2'-phosphotransferase
MSKQDVSKSKFLSLVLRHKPETIGISLDPNGWVDVDALLDALEEHNHAMSIEELERVVRENDKQRFILSEDRRRIRANQGHSVQVDLGLQPQVPPESLFHGTIDAFMESIFANGLQKGQRHHVHLSPNLETAIKVGQRRGKPVILEIRSGEMHRAGHNFFVSANGVWLTDFVPVQFIVKTAQ